MKKINKKSINYGLRILTILAFVFIFMPFNQAAAQISGYGTNSPGGNGGNYNNNYNNSYYNTTPYQAPVYIAPAVAPTPIVYSSGANPNATSDVMTVNYTPAPVAIKTKTTASPATNSDNASDLAANAVYGSNSFMPSGIIQWVLFAIFILLLVILIRKIFGAEEKYQATPLKHE
jgi:hypothetical protein